MSAEVLNLNCLGILWKCRSMPENLQMSSRDQNAAVSGSDIGNLLSAIQKQSEAVATYISAQDEDTAAKLTASLLQIAARATFHDPRRSSRVFDDAEAFGAHFMPVHFYSIVPNLRELSPTVFKRRFDQVENLRLDRKSHIAWIDRLSKFSDELSAVPADQAGEHPHFFWNNTALWPTDAITYYAFLRELKPKRIIEIGSGNSTMLAAMAVEKNGFGLIKCIEPYPSPALRQLTQSGRISLEEMRVQDCPLSVFEELSDGDVLFIDSTHICNVGSDVTYEILSVLPAVAKGVYIHIHDIFHPHEYPEHWIRDRKFFWNEQYLVLAFLAYNPSFRIEVSVSYIGDELADVFMDAFSSSHPKCAVGGSSLWIHKLGGSEATSA
jgi:hypothetical protein